jgi:hypothetical protein
MYQMDGSQLQQQYKHHISDYKDWDQREHAKEWMLFEKNITPAEYAGQTLHSKGFYPEVRVQDFPIRENKVELSIKRRRWEVQSTGEIVSRNWDLVMKGARLTKEFALFLKDAFGRSSD